MQNFAQNSMVHAKFTKFAKINGLCKICKKYKICKITQKNCKIIITDNNNNKQNYTKKLLILIHQINEWIKKTNKFSQSKKIKRFLTIRTLYY